MTASLTAARPQLTAATPLFSPFSLGQLRLPNRIMMAPLTRARADEHRVPSVLAAQYYAQRAGAGLIIAEATAVSRQGTGYDNWPGLYTADQQAGWRKITRSVHAGNGYLLDQFLRDGANRRDDEYGGTARNRARLLREVTAAVIGVWGSSRVGVRISPLSPTNGMTDSDPVATFTQTADDGAAGVRGLLQLPPGAPRPGPGRATAAAARWHHRLGSFPGPAA